MLPDFPKQKAKLMSLFNQTLQQRLWARLGFVGDIPRYTHYEGRAWILEKSDGSRSEQNYEDVRSMLSIQTSDVPNLSFEKIIVAIDQIADNMASQVWNKFIASLTTATNHSPVEANGQPFTKEFFLERLANLDIGFNQNESPEITVLISPDLGLSEDELSKWQTDPDFNAQFDRIIDEKREAWRARQNTRKLVD